MGLPLGGLSAVDVYGGPGNRAGGSRRPSQLVEGTGSDQTIDGAYAAKWLAGLIVLLVVIRFVWERGAKL